MRFLFCAEFCLAFFRSMSSHFPIGKVTKKNQTICADKHF